MIRNIHPQGDVIGERIVYVASPDMSKKCLALEDEIKKLRARPAEIRREVVEKIVEKPVEDKALLEKLNLALRENAQLKKFQQPTRVIEKPVEVERVIEVEVEKVVEKVIEHVNLKLLIGASFGSFLAGLGIGQLF